MPLLWGMSPRALPLAAVLLASFAPRAVLAQWIGATTTISTPHYPSAAGIRWSVPVNHVTSHVPDWGTTDLGLAGGFLAILWVDAAQTRSVARQNWRGFHEANPILGDSPSVGQINTYTAAVAIGTLGIAAVLPKRTRRWWLTGALAVEACVVVRNASAGLSLRF